jgi:hypothetical protein
MKSNAIKSFSLATLSLGAALCSTGCQMFEVHSAKTDEVFLKQYCSSDPLVADRALTGYRNSYENRQDWGYKLNGYDDLYAITDARQMEVNQVLNRPEYVAIYYRSATNNLAHAAISQGKPVKTWTQEDVKAVADQADAGLTVRWKK